jgi:hypothetical protein
MPNFSAVSNDTAAARHAASTFESAVNVVLDRLKAFCERVDDLCTRLLTACTIAEDDIGQIKGLEPVVEGFEDHRASLGDELTEIEIAAHEIDELVEECNDLVNKLSSLRAPHHTRRPFLSEDTSMRIKPQTTSPQIWTSFHLGAGVRLVAGVHCPNCGTELRACDVIIDQAGGRTGLICSGCHRDILAIEPKS